MKGRHGLTLNKLEEDRELSGEFKRFLEYNQHSIENLNFILWFKAYKQRFNELQQSEQDKSISPKSKSKKKHKIGSPPPEQPFRPEIDQVITIYFDKASHFELNLPEDIQKAVIDLANLSTHPDCFLKAYDHVHYLIESSSIPEFLNHKYPQTSKPSSSSKFKQFFRSL
ncbi:hypothetical protein WALSEDRAFT_57999 [Wallemia mellicola CBS 633.66]|uniref:RGS domain-containing protein n=1 Tax=Wallemia mellicola (strain ATCC MYA-4683 / CBS 633.66) TaxID=671144 RepID=I4Y9S4_WALMC|nr:hypothetical protein WALSEDRAFT_57999 [Wallemia mellicola CBS 633.66]EIM20716.1 hypothetical protein WALSEDRAFT_57999 [Wallemia mellicola CBS 633.66]|eukprot:XP_006959249.1 hypothetical protein WALSEDRAFT_57999 [Wallemia mellicola CBS 633.66]